MNLTNYCCQSSDIVVASWTVMHAIEVPSSANANRRRNTLYAEKYAVNIAFINIAQS